MLFTRAVILSVLAAGCSGSAATTGPAVDGRAEVVPAHGYAVPREQLAADIQASAAECGWTLTSSDADAGVFVGQKNELFGPRGQALTITIRPAGDRLRVDVTSTSPDPHVLGDHGLNRGNVHAFYDALDRRAGDPPPR